MSDEILDDRNGCNTQKNPLEINITLGIFNIITFCHPLLGHDKQFLK